jgi:leader peptidase (prepilin peptidase)/N-methyltransferase
LTSLILAFDHLPFWFVASLLALLGTIFGSFAGAVCVRWPFGESVVTGRSRCDHCHANLRIYELIPILSYLLQRGRCRSCGKAISASLLWIEIACASLGLACAVLFSPSQAATAAFFCWLLVPLIILDWRHYWLPDALLIWLGIGGLIIGGSAPGALPITDRLIGGAIGFFVLELLRRLYSRLRGIDAMGAGDPKLYGVLGLWLGWQALPPLMLVASLLGIADHVRRQYPKGRSEKRLPLGAYLSITAMLWVFIV